MLQRVVTFCNIAKGDLLCTGPASDLNLLHWHASIVIAENTFSLGRLRTSFIVFLKQLKNVFLFRSEHMLQLLPSPPPPNFIIDVADLCPLSHLRIRIR